MRFYSNENFPLPTVKALRKLGHDVLTSEEAGNAHRQISDPEVLRYAIEQDRAVLTINRRDFIKLHRHSSRHSGIVVCTINPNFEEQAAKIHAAIQNLSLLTGELIRINKGNET